MTQFDALLGGFVDDILAVPAVRLAGLAIAGATIVLWLAAAWWTMGDVRRRSDGLVGPYLAAAAVVLAGPLLFPAVLVAYAVVRPPVTLDQRRWQELDARLAALETVDRCPSCHRAVSDDWLRCPDCRQRLAFECAACGRPMGVDWELCAWCGAEFTAAPSGTARRAVPVDAPASVAPVRADSGAVGALGARSAAPVSIAVGPRHRA